jgi:hypothetical protein
MKVPEGERGNVPGPGELDAEAGISPWRLRIEWGIPLPTPP